MARIKMPQLGKTAKKALITAGTIVTVAGAWIGYCQCIAKPETYIEYKIDEHQKEKVTIENKLIYATEVGHQKVILFMGGLYERTQGPGLNFRLPFEKAYDVDMERVVKLERGFRTKVSDVKTEYLKGVNFDHESLMVTRDEGELKIEYIIQYIKEDPSKFLFNVKNPNETVSEVAESALREVIATKTYDEVLTTGKADIQLKSQKIAQKMLDDYKTGIRIKKIILQPINPPTPEVQKAFDGINDAIQMREQLIQEGMAEYEQKTREAVGDKQRIIEQAKGEASEKVNKAAGNVARYLELYEGYKKAPEANKFRIREETKRKLLEKSKVKIIDPDASGSLLQHLMIDDKEGGAQ